MNACRIAAGCAALWLLVSCSGPYYARSINESLERTRKVVLMDSGLRNDVAAGAMRVERLDNGILAAEVQIRNETAKPLALQLKVKFKDSGGFVIEETNWMPEVVQNHEEHSLKVNSLSTNANDFVVLVKYAE